jgi:hypothetical protein
MHKKELMNFTKQKTGSNAFINRQIKDNSPVAIQVGRPTDPGLNALRLALDPELQTKQQALLNKNNRNSKLKIKPISNKFDTCFEITGNQGINYGAR